MSPLCQISNSNPCLRCRPDIENKYDNKNGNGRKTKKIKPDILEKVKKRSREAKKSMASVAAALGIARLPFTLPARSPLTSPSRFKVPLSKPNWLLFKSRINGFYSTSIVAEISCSDWLQVLLWSVSRGGVRRPRKGFVSLEIFYK